MILPNVSPSQIDLYESCQRKWYLNKVKKIPTPPTMDQELGIQKHAEIEIYFRHGTLPTSECVKQAVKLLPARDTDKQLLEHKFSISTYKGGPAFFGVIDFLHEVNAKHIVIYDHKTTGDLRYAKTPAELARNLQLLSYGKYVSDLPAKYEVIEGAHCYMQIPKGRKRNPEAAQLIPPVRLTRQAIDGRWTKSIESTKTMVTLAKAEPSIDDVAPNWDECGAYGGCPYREICNATKKETTTMGLLDRMRAKSQEAQAAPKREITITVEEGVLPPDAPPPIEDRPAPVAQAAVEEAPKKRGRPKKEMSESAPETSATTITTTASAPVTPKTNGHNNGHGGFDLYVDCLPVRTADTTPVILCEDWIRPIAIAVAEENSVEDYRLMPFGAGKVALSIAIRKSPSPVGAFVVNKMSPGADEVIAVLAPMARTVVKALKG